MDNRQAKVKFILADLYDNDPIRDFATGAEEQKIADAISCNFESYGVMLLDDWLYDVKHIRSQLPDGLIAFWGHSTGVGFDTAREMVVVLGKTQFDIMRIMQTNGNEADLTTDDIIVKLQDLDTRYGINIFGANYDSVEFELKTVPDDLTSLAQEMYAFCPDCVEQGVGTLEKLVEAYQKTIKHFNTLAISLWWD